MKNSVVDLVLHNRTKSRAYGRAFFARAAEAALPYLKVPRGARAEIAVILVGPAAMHTLNRTRRGKDAPTDVLSFALPSPQIRGYTAVSLGDVFLCPAVVRVKARQWNRTEREQMRWSFVHGLLHLAGYDHERGPAAAKKMASAEQRILKKVNS